MISNPAAKASTIPLVITASPSTPPTPSPPTKPTPVLVVLHPDGYVEAFADEPTAVHIASLPVVSDRADAEIAAEAWLESRLPLSHRKLYAPGNLRATELHRPPRPSDIARRQTLAELWRAMDQFGRDAK